MAQMETHNQSEIEDAQLALIVIAQLHS